MKSTRLFCAVLAFASATVFAQSNPVPLLYQVTPNSIKPGHAAFTLSVKGTGFVSGATVSWNGAPLTTTFVNGSVIEASVPAADVAVHQSALVTVANKGGVASNVIYFPVRMGSPTVSLNANYTSIEPGVVTVGYFDADQTADIVVDGAVDEGTYYLDTYFGTGTGGFTKVKGPRWTSFGAFVCEPNIAADFSNNGKMDLALCNFDGADPIASSLLLGNGLGQFHSTAAAINGRGVAADMNGDGNLDTVTVYNDGMPSLFISLGNGKGQFTIGGGAGQLNYNAAGIPVVGDFNGDGKLDVAIPSASALMVFLGNGDGTVQGEVDYPMSYVSSQSFAVVADVNGDGNLDVVTNGVCVMLGAGDGSFTNSSCTPVNNEAAGNVLVGDVNGDGKLDVATVSVTEESNALTLNVFPGNGDGSFQSPITYDLNIGGLAPLGMADFNNDGKLDFVVGGATATALMLQR